MSLAADYRLVIFDLDGVVYLGATAVPGAPAAIRAVADRGTSVAYVTNNASRSAAEVAALLAGLGVPARPGDVVTSAQAAAELLAADLPEGAPVLVVGAPALWAEIARAGLTVVHDASARPLAVVQGYGPRVGWSELAEACVAIRAGARWVATNTDATLPSSRGPLPGNGSLVAALSTALGGRSPDTLVGKPEPLLFRVAAAGRDTSQVLVVGDRLDTDIEGADRAGMDSLLVLTGVTTPSDLLSAPTHRRPSHVAADCFALSTSEDLCVPPWADDAAVASGWRVSRDGDRLVLDGGAGVGPRDTARTAKASGGEAAGNAGSAPPADAVAALRALARGAWTHPEWTGITPVGPVARAALADLGLSGRSAPAG